MNLFFERAKDTMRHQIGIERAKLQAMESAIRQRMADAVKKVKEAANEAARQGTGKANDPLAGAYRYLGVSADDSVEFVKAVYRTKARFLHPDVKTGNKESFQLLEAAYRLVLEDLRKRGKS